MRWVGGGGVEMERLHMKSASVHVLQISRPKPPMELCVIKGQQKTSQKYLEFALLVQLYFNPVYST